MYGLIVPTTSSNQVLELTPEGMHRHGGGYTEYVARTGEEAPPGSRG